MAAANDPGAVELARALDRAGWRIDAHDRAIEKIGKSVSVIERRIDELDTMREIARAVANAEAKKVSRQRASRYSAGELVIGSIVAGASVGGLLLQLLHAGGHG